MNTRKTARYAEPHMPYAKAVRRYTEEKIREIAGSSQTLTNWKAGGLPGHAVAKLRGQAPLTTLIAELVESPPAVLMAVDQVKKVWEMSNEGKGIGWGALTALLEYLAKSRGS